MQKLTNAELLKVLGGDEGTIPPPTTDGKKENPFEPIT
jgi:hypothetical protein